MIGRSGILRINAADSLKCAGITLEDAQEKAVVPFVVNDLYDDGASDTVGVHQREKFFRRGIFGRRGRAGGEGKLRVVLEDMDMRIDQRSAVLGFGQEQWEGERACGGLSEEAAAGGHFQPIEYGARLQPGGVCGGHGRRRESLRAVAPWEPVAGQGPSRA